MLLKNLLIMVIVVAGLFCCPIGAHAGDNSGKRSAQTETRSDTTTITARLGSLAHTLVGGVLVRHDFSFSDTLAVRKQNSIDGLRRSLRSALSGRAHDFAGFMGATPTSVYDMSREVPGLNVRYRSGYWSIKIVVPVSLEKH